MSVATLRSGRDAWKNIGYVCSYIKGFAQQIRIAHLIGRLHKEPLVGRTAGPDVPTVGQITRLELVCADWRDLKATGGNDFCRNAQEY
jgi:hypothetical protein